MLMNVPLPYKSHHNGSKANSSLVMDSPSSGLANSVTARRDPFLLNTSRSWAKVKAGEVISSNLQYCQTSISVQLLRGNTQEVFSRSLAPIERFQSSGLWFFEVPLTKCVSVGKEPLFSSSLFLISTTTPRHASKGFLFMASRELRTARHSCLGSSLFLLSQCPDLSNPAPSYDELGIHPANVLIPKSMVSKSCVRCLHVKRGKVLLLDKGFNC